MNHKKDTKEKEKDIVKNEIVNELKEDGGDIDLIKVDIQGLVSMMNEYGIRRYDMTEFSIEDIIQDFIQRSSSLNSFFLMDIGQIFRRYKFWKKKLPKIEILYAAKCNPDKLLLKTLSYLGLGFDVASKAEISMVDELDISREQIIFANPVKEIDHIIFARSKGIALMTFDNEDELKKISVFHPHAKLILRILVDDSKSRLPFGSKFGCQLNNLESIFILAKQLELQIIGVSFHVGSGGTEPSTFADAISNARQVFKIAESHGFNFKLLDIGGGLPGPDDRENNDNFEKIADSINAELEKQFSDVEGLRIISEPGRFFACSVGTLVCNVIGKKLIKTDETTKAFHYYVNSNLYGMFNNIIFDKAVIKLNLLNNYPETKYKSVIFGQTCDSMDKIAEGVELPELACGDWIYVINQGAYTIASASNFNGFFPADVKYIYTF